MTEHPNCEAVATFLDLIPSVSRPICKTRNIDGKPAEEGYTAAWHDQKRDVGFTVLAWGDGEFLVVIEGKLGRRTMQGTLSNAKQFAGRVNKVLFS